MGEVEGSKDQTLLLSALSQTILNDRMDPAFNDVDAIVMPLAGAEAHIDSLAKTILSQEEWQCARRAVSSADYIAKVGSRLLLRAALSRRFGKLPAAWRFRHSAEGQLMLANAGYGRARFSVARTPAMVAVAITTDMSVGIDLESAQRLRDANLDPRDWLSPREIASERGLDPVQRDLDRLRRWTLKEAYSKGLGTGFLLPPRDMGFGLSQDRRSARVQLARPSAGWHFHLIELDSEYVASIAIQHPFNDKKFPLVKAK